MKRKQTEQVRKKVGRKDGGEEGGGRNIVQTI